MNSSPDPKLSVVVIVLAGGHHLERCLEALRRQESSPSMEVIVPHREGMPSADSLGARFPEVRFLPMPGRSSYAQARTAGLRSARGEILAITEDQCIPPPQWCANVVAAHAGPHVAVGGPVEKQEPDTPINWSIYLRELGTYMPPVHEGPSECLTDCNVSYKREALEAIAALWQGAFHEPQVHAALREHGGTLWLSPSMLTFQQRAMQLGPAILERYEFGRLYGSLRVETASPLRRLALALATPLLPIVLLGRVILTVLRKRRHVAACIRALPYLVLFSLAWSWGECLGYLTGRASPKGAASG
jgi:hypothetical protein